MVTLGLILVLAGIWGGTICGIYKLERLSREKT
jgi:hypothetical protein